MAAQRDDFQEAPLFGARLTPSFPPQSQGVGCQRKRSQVTDHGVFILVLRLKLEMIKVCHKIEPQLSNRKLPKYYTSMSRSAQY